MGMLHPNLCYNFVRGKRFINPNLLNVMNSESRYNVGQYGLKPWMANVIMGIAEVVAVIVWYVCSAQALISSVMSFDAQNVEETSMGVTVAICAIYLVWSALVWFVKPLRTKFNAGVAKWNLIFIALTIAEMFI